MKIYSININLIKIIFLFLIGNYNFYTSQQQEYSINYETQFQNILDLFIGKFKKIKDFFNNQKNIEQWKLKNYQNNIDDFLKHNSSVMILPIGKKLYSIEKSLKNSSGYCNLQNSYSSENNIEFLNILKQNNINDYFTSNGEIIRYFNIKTINQFCDIVINIINEIKKKRIIGHEWQVFNNENIYFLEIINREINLFLNELDIQSQDESRLFIRSEYQNKINSDLNHTEDKHDKAREEKHKEDPSKGFFSNHIGLIFKIIVTIIIGFISIYFFQNQKKNTNDLLQQNELLYIDNIDLKEKQDNDDKSKLHKI